ncbi:NAD(P)-binding protein [Linnemannia elongata AG-77]|uniref:Probable quinone oxidoreductase n=1 Tax=Linnemannia elongata AG-77 TaxID=1314771 RepID=A0A197JC61_9FUNG|nr:NAD(P)-binding protein [Linnemannia elongata AG-77]
MVNSTARVIRVTKYGDASALQPTNIPRPIPKPTQVLVKVAYAGVNYVDIYERSGNFPSPLPLIPGREGSGEIVEVGSEVQGFKVGDRVAFIGKDTYSDYAVVDTVHLAKLPDHVSLETGAAFILQGLTAVGLIRKAYAVQKGDWIVVHAAAGGVGLLLSQLGRLLGAHVIGTVSTEEKAALARANGAEHVVLINNGYEALEKKVRELTNGEGVHAVFDSVGQATFESSLNIVRRLGTLVLFGNASGEVPPLNLMRLSSKNVKVTWAAVYNYITTPEDFNELVEDTLEYLEKGQLKIAIHKVYPVEDVQQAHLDLEGRKTTGKLLLKIQ